MLYLARYNEPMNKKLKIFIIAGEVSGDVLGAKIMAAAKNAEFIGIGGENMQACGLRTLFPISDLAVMGLFEVIANARTLTRRINETVDAIIKEKPDIVLTIDSPSFAKRVIQKVKKISQLSILNSPVFYHVVAPQVWAWGEKRAKKFAEIFDRLYCFFDFEVPYFTKYGLETIAVGHPIASGLKQQKKFEKNQIALIPGSRMSEVKKLLPIFKKASELICNQNPSDVWYNFYIPVVETTKEYIKKETADWCVKPELVPALSRYELFANTDIAIAASGTVSAELAIMHVPAIVVYKMNPVTEFFARFMLKIKWVSLVNILLKKTVCPELLGKDCTSEHIAGHVKKLLTASSREKMVSELFKADNLWHKNRPAAKLIAGDLLRF
ncbi:lipid-A-disaccharide synthase [Bacteroidia bacterium]|nr:lipid-A-disaccharide synthase [Bacteroidia bacterium]